MKKLIKKMLELYKQYKEIIDYLIVGGCVTVINFISYTIPAKMFGINEVVSNIHTCKPNYLKKTEAEENNDKKNSSS